MATDIKLDQQGGGWVIATGNLGVTGGVTFGATSLGDAITDLRAAIQSTETSAGNVGYRLNALEKTVESLVRLAGAVVIPRWRTKTEVEQGDDMGVSAPSAEQLGLVVEYEIEQLNPNYAHEEVFSITPQAGTLVMRGTAVVVRINLQG